ncbi:uncharacterized protein BO80DRAFT_460068 [Aspergillus ibericus CBS 121593]|uniref:Uncharacterized protein n=1 Tax=Aspergillus ibericus CBS 121593 TaxID=1448316 RepID=A0A395GIP7_9EURO|nr:hypothetical protein BO80DRAFT_460068 [Aspergillus ibericus CBS 121593]RAK95076.1 hypothetical protein BO80DRAFT_460068 [Aspergillus ibericus CBS 121593]
MTDQPPVGRDFLDAKNVEPIDQNDSDLDESASQPRFSGPGANTTAPSTSKPHSNKLLNKLDPRYDSDILEATSQDQQREQRRGSD